MSASALPDVDVDAERNASQPRLLTASTVLVCFIVTLTLFLTLILILIIPSPPVSAANGNTSAAPTSPTVVSTFPADGATEVDPSVTIKVTFSKEIDTSTLAVPDTILVWSPETGQRFEGAIEYENASNIMTYSLNGTNRVVAENHTAHYPYDTQIQVILTQEICDRDGNRLDGKNLGIPNECTWSFTTANESKHAEYTPAVSIFSFDIVLPAPLDNPLGVFVIQLTYWIAIGVMVIFLLSPVTKRFTKRTKTEIDDIILGIVRGPLLILIILFGIINSLETLKRTEKNPLGVIPPAFLGTMYLIYRLVLILIITWVAYRILKDLLVYYGRIYSKKLRGSEQESALFPLIEKIGSVVIILAGGLYTLTYLGVDLTMFIAGAGLIGVFIAVSMQDSLSNFASGINITVDKPFIVGDMIKLPSGAICRVVNIGMRATRLYDVIHHQLIVLPNKNIADSEIVNLSRPDTQMRLNIDVEVAYGSDVKVVKSILIDRAEDHDQVVTTGDLAPKAMLLEFAASGIKFRLWVWITDVEDQFQIGSDIREGIMDAFCEADITIPFPQRTLWWGDVNQNGSENMGANAKQ